jgi:predicted DNA-binding transcriptional regulator YafY
MRKAERLFQLALIMRAGRVVTAHRLARELGVCERTIYRDMEALTLAGVPIDGEAGVGYRMRPGWELPPLMFDREEAKALMLGVRMVRAWADPALRRAAGRVLEKVEAVAPPALLNALSDETLLAPGFHVSREVAARLQVVREAIETHHKLRLAYTRADGESSKRTVRPLGLVYWGSTWTLSAWCEERRAFREFRIDRMQSCTPLKSTFPDEPGKRFKDYLAQVGAESPG